MNIKCHVSKFNVIRGEALPRHNLQNGFTSYVLQGRSFSHTFNNSS
jgi:hypothetical protein